MEKSLKITIDSITKSKTIVNIKGFLNSDSKGIFGQTIVKIKNKSKNYIFIIKDLEYVSSSGVGSFMELYEIVNERGGKICFVGMSEPVRRVFDYMGFLSFFGDKMSLDEASEYIKH